MTDYERNADVSKTLTEQWKKGELCAGWYYVQLIRGEYRIDLYIKDKNEWIDCPDAIIDAVVCAVPSYEEWQRTFHYAGKYEHEYTSCVMDYENLKQENKQLKELLKEYKKQLSEIKNAYIDLTTQDEYGSYYIDEAKLLRV